MRLIIRIILIFQLCSFGLFAQYPQADFIPPLNIPLVLSGTFGELRGNHFHSGMDIKTQGKEGLVVLSIADGYVSRIKVSPYGFGNAIYVRHPNGYTSVYAHLQRFSPEIQAYVRKSQYSKKSFGVDLFLSSKQFQLKQGDTIALSGNSGGSGGPHLHFEIRDSRTEKIINPLFFGFDVEDTKAPKLIDLQLYEYVEGELTESKSLSVLKLANNKYSLTGDEVLECSSEFAFGIRAFDRLNGSNNKNGLYSTELYINNELEYSFAASSFSFATSRYINSHIDYAQKVCCGKTIDKLYLDEGNKLDLYLQKCKAPLKLNTDSIADVRIVLKDFAGNTSELNFKIKPIRKERLESLYEIESSIFKYNQVNFFKNDHVNILLKENCLYSNMYFNFSIEKSNSSIFVSQIYNIGNAEIPVHKYYSMAITPSSSFDFNPSKVGIVSLDNGKVKSWLGGKYEKKTSSFEAKVREFGQFALIEDTIPQQCKPLEFKDGIKLTVQSKIKFVIGDNLSGLNDYSVQIDGQWVLFEYDAKNKLISANLSDLDLNPGEHNLIIELTDDVNNRIHHSYSFFLN